MAPQFLALNSINKPSFFTKESNGKMYVKYEVVGSQHVAVPTHFYKMVVGENQDGSLEMECYVMENTVIDDNISLQSFQINTVCT
ncbi:hypothetical protein HUJ04_011392 [Dendroctonus ponderosae]|nr:hypothetical protein HUJ04_011392 [Dendroctonus ponderosae]